LSQNGLPYDLDWGLSSLISATNMHMPYSEQFHHMQHQYIYQKGSTFTKDLADKHNTANAQHVHQMANE